MTHRRSIDIRKQPHQERARATLDAILVAATRVLEREGLARLTTTRIADVAGVSVGSLYQYFPNREAIVGALIDQQLDTMLTTFRRLLVEQATLPLEDAVTTVLCGLLAVAGSHERLHAALYDEMSVAQRTERHQCTLDTYAELVAATLASRHDVDVADEKIAARLIVHASDGVIRSLVASNDPATSCAVIREAVQMICRYLAPSGMRSTRA